MAGAIGDDELPLGRREVAICHVDRNALLPLGLEAIGQERGVEPTACGAMLDRVFLDGCEGVLVDHLRLIEQHANERTLAVIHTAAGEEAQKLLILMLL